MAASAVRPIAETEIEAAGQIFAAAFHDDPLQVYAFPDPVERARRSPGSSQP
jgi:hypothetical protein